MEDFHVLGEISNVETIAEGTSIRDLLRLSRAYGGGKRWRKLKGSATVKLANGRIRHVEVHWYEAHGVGRKELKIKRYLD
ncbi:MAG: hypothetical protein ABUT39_06870 [Acidobacteriota bacterium]